VLEAQSPPNAVARLGSWLRVGDVSLIVARLVGPSEEVVAIERDDRGGRVPFISAIRMEI
jgi:hypothetical protein